MKQDNSNRVQVGNRYGSLTVVMYSHLYRAGQHMWLCRCDCGNETRVREMDLRRTDSRATRTCGKVGCPHCKRHGHAVDGKVSPTYSSWRSMKYRVKAEERYIQKGITMCPEWEQFGNFLRDMGERPSEEYTIERIDNAGRYCKENCRWATWGEQARNKDSNHCVTINGRTEILAVWLREIGMDRACYYSRIYHQGMTPEQAITTWHMRRPTKEEVSEMKRLHSDGFSYREIGERMGFNKATIMRRCHRVSVQPELEME